MAVGGGKSCDRSMRKNELLLDERFFYARKIQDIVKTEFSHLKGVAYLDHAASTLYAQSQLSAVFSDLSANLYGNPHSRNASSKLSSDVVDQVRYRVAQYFNTSTDDYHVIFTSGATGALRLLADAFDWNSKEINKNVADSEPNPENPGHFFYLEDNHTSVLGVRVVANEHGASSRCISIDECVEAIGNASVHREIITHHAPNQNCLFAYPAESNFCGRKYPLEWIEAVQNVALDGLLTSGQSRGGKRWSVLLDAAGYVGNSGLDLKRWTPEFICISFHKMFGFPTGLGALLVKRSAESLLTGGYFGGGSVSVAIAREDVHVFRENVMEKFESGTVSFLDILAVQHGFDCVRRITGNPMTIAGYTFNLARYVHHRLATYRHGNGQPAVILYCQTDFEDAETQGAIVNFNLLRSDGHHVGFAEVEKMAAVYDIHFRTGCMCNPGACQRYLNLTSDELKQHFQAGHVCGDEKDLIDGSPTGSIRVSFGYMSTLEDARRLLAMIESCFVENDSQILIEETGLHRDVISKESRQDQEKHDDKSIAERSFSANVGAKKSSEIAWSPWTADDKNDVRTMSRKLLAKSPEVDSPKGGVGDNQSEDVVADANPLQLLRTTKEIENGFWNGHATRNSSCNCVAYGLDKCVGIHVRTIAIFPIKSCGAFQVSSWRVGTRGFLYDREWMVVNCNGVSLTQKRLPQMCLIKPEVDLKQEVLWLRYKEMPAVSVPLITSNLGRATASATICQTKVCGDRVEAIDCGDEVANWLSNVLEIDGCRLLRQSPTFDRTRTMMRKQPRETVCPNGLSLANEAQYLLLNLESCKALAQKMCSKYEAQELMPDFDGFNPIDVHKLIARFRGNLVVEGAPSFDEEEWQHLDIGRSRFKIDGPCNRCQMICINQDSGKRTKEPLLTLASTRGRKMNFGIYLSLLDATGYHANPDKTEIVQIDDPIIVS